MPATILDFTAGDTERGVKIQNSQIFRKIKDDTWTTLRVGVRWICTDDTTSAPTAGAQFALGLCNGSTEGMGSSNRKHCLVLTNVNSSGNITSIGRVIGALIFALTTAAPSTNLRVCKYLNNVQTIGSDWMFAESSISRFIQGGISSTFYSTVFFFDITRASPDYTLRGFMKTGVDTATTTRQIFLEQMEATTPLVSGYEYTGTPRTIAVDEAIDGTLDHFHFYWNRTAPSITILDAAVCKIA